MVLTMFKGLSRLWQSIVVLVVIIAAVWAFTFVRGLFVGTADVEAEIGANQAGAAIQSGQDAVESVGANQEQSNATKGKVKGVQNEVSQAKDGAGADAAARDGLCVQFGLCSKE